MRIRNRSLVIMLGQGVTHVSAMAVGIVLVRIISQETFGTYRQVLLVYTTISTILSLQLDQTLYYFVPKLAEDARRKLVAQTLALASGMAIASGLAMFAFAGPVAAFFDNPPLASHLRAFCLFPLADGVSILVPAYMIGLDRAVRASVYSIIKALARLAVVVSAFALGAGIDAVLWLLVASSAAIALVGCGDMVRLGGTGAFRISKPMITDQFRYALPIWMSSIVGTLHVQYDKFLISAAFDPATYAVYFCGAMELPITMLVTTSITAAMMPNLVNQATRGDLRDALDLWHEGIRKCSLVVFPFFAFFLPVSREFIVLLYGRDYAAAAGPFAIYLFALPLHVAVWSTLFRAAGRTRPVAVSAAISLGVNVVVSTGFVWLGRGTPLAFVGPAIGTVVADAVDALYLLGRIGSVSRVPFSRVLRWRELGETMALCAAAGAAIYLLPLERFAELPLAAGIAVRGACFALLIAILGVVTGHLRPDERELLRAPWSALRGRTLE
jgi:O-antigen/teichoic acid export membrane protein